MKVGKWNVSCRERIDEIATFTNWCCMASEMWSHPLLPLIGQWASPVRCGHIPSCHSLASEPPPVRCGHVPCCHSLASEPHPWDVVTSLAATHWPVSLTHEMGSRPLLPLIGQWAHVYVPCICSHLSSLCFSLLVSSCIILFASLCWVLYLTVVWYSVTLFPIIWCCSHFCGIGSCA